MKTPQQIVQQATKLITQILLSDDRSSNMAARWTKLQLIREKFIPLT